MGRYLYIVYRLIFMPVFILAAAILALFNKKLKARTKIEKEFRKHRPENLKKKKAKRILIHCSSLGEWEQAAPVAELLKNRKPDIEIVVSFFSISGYNHLKAVPYVDHKIFLPFDTYRRASSFLKFIKPDLWIISAYDVWPNHVMAANNNGIPMVVISATLAATTSRNKGLQGMLNAYVFGFINGLYPRSVNDARRFLKMYPFPEKVNAFGDTRADRVFEKSRKILQAPNIRVFSNKLVNDVVFIAGSCWPADETVIIPGLAVLLGKYDQLKVIMVPHEIKTEHIENLENQFLELGYESERYTDFKEKGGTDKRVAIIDAIGVLASLYKETSIAYVGGSFGKGVHNVLEPAVFEMPVLVGPRHHNSQEALTMKEMGVIFEITNTAGFTRIMDRLISENDFRNYCGQEALGYIKNNMGASEKIVDHLTKAYNFL